VAILRPGRQAQGEKLRRVRQTSAGDTIEYIDDRNSRFQTGGFGLIQDKSFDRKFYGGSATRYAGAHQLKGGIEIEDQTANVIKRMSGGQQVEISNNPNNAASRFTVTSTGRRLMPR